MGSGASSDLRPLKVESVNPCTEAMIRRRRADSVRRAAGRRRGSKKNFSKKLKNFLSIFHPLWRISHLLYIERGTRHLWDGKKILSPDTGSYGLTRRLFVWQRPHELEDRWPLGLFPKSPADRYLIDESVCESALSCVECKPVSGRLLTRGWFDSLSRFEWTRKTVDGTWNLKKNFFKKISKYKASALEDYAFT
jgi:hypothetical protein